MASWHLVTPDGHAYSAGSAFPHLLRLLPGGRIPAAVTSTFPRSSERVYRFVAARRVFLGRLLTRVGGASVRKRAERRIAERARWVPPRNNERQPLG